jgi:predicted enzyme related to lactoylglutathione lyase
MEKRSQTMKGSGRGSGRAGHRAPSISAEKAAAIRYKEIAFTAYPVTDMARARKFYEGVLGLKPNAPVQSADVHWIEYDVGPGTLGIGSSPNWLPSQEGPSLALEVEDFDAAIAVLNEHKIPIIIGPMEMPSCRMATVRDPDGNKLTIHKRKR